MVEKNLRRVEMGRLTHVLLNSVSASLHRSIGVRNYTKTRFFKKGAGIKQNLK